MTSEKRDLRLRNEGKSSGVPDGAQIELPQPNIQVERFEDAQTHLPPRTSISRNLETRFANFMDNIERRVSNLEKARSQTTITRKRACESTPRKYPTTRKKKGPEPRAGPSKSRTNRTLTTRLVEDLRRKLANTLVISSPIKSLGVGNDSSNRYTSHVTEVYQTSVKRSPGGPPRRNRTPLTISRGELFEKLRYRADLPAPRSMNPAAKDRRQASGKFCEFHKDHGHLTDCCREFSLYVEQLISNGELDNLVKRSRDRNNCKSDVNGKRPRSPSPDSDNGEDNLLKTIHMLCGGRPTKRLA